MCQRLNSSQIFLELPVRDFSGVALPLFFLFLHINICIGFPADISQKSIVLQAVQGFEERCRKSLPICILHRRQRAFSDSVEARSDRAGKCQIRICGSVRQGPLNARAAVFSQGKPKRGIVVMSRPVEPGRCLRTAEKSLVGVDERIGKCRDRGLMSCRNRFLPSL